MVIVKGNGQGIYIYIYIYIVFFGSKFLLKHIKLIIYNTKFKRQTSQLKIT